MITTYKYRSDLYIDLATCDLRGKRCAVAAWKSPTSPPAALVPLTDDRDRLRSGNWGVLDEPTLRAIAAETGGEYFSAAEAGRLRAIYRDLARTIGWEKRPQEVTTIVGTVAMALLVASVVLRFRVAPLQ